MSNSITAAYPVKSSDAPALQPYADGPALLADLFTHLDERLRMLARSCTSKEQTAGDLLLQGLVVTDSEIQQILDSGSEQGAAVFSPGSLWEAVQSRVELTRACGRNLPLEIIRERFGLSTFEIECLAICLAPEIDPKYEKLFGYLNDDVTRKYPTPHLLVNLLCSADNAPMRYRRHLLPTARLFRAGLLSFVDESPSTNAGSHLKRPVRVEPGVVQFLLEERQFDSELESHLAHSPYPANAAELWAACAELEPLEELLQEHLTQAGLEQERLVCILSGRNGSGRRYAAETVCRRFGLDTIPLDCRRLLRQPAADRLLAKAFRDSILNAASLILVHSEAILEDRERGTDFCVSLQRLLAELGWMVFICLPETTKVWQSLGRVRSFEIVFPDLDIDQRRALWQSALTSAGIGDNQIAPLSDELAPKFRMTAGEIALTVSKAANSRLLSAPGQSWRSDLHRCASQVCAPRLGELAREVKALYTWEQLVLPAPKTELVRDIVRHVEHRRKVMEDWGFGKRLNRGKGLNVLFAGVPGTGKTMAAEVISNALGMSLYRIDLAGVVSKYIGETEKNLSRIFKEAEHSDAILFFDEADALCGKRSEVRDAHDRYANIEINYLLQLIEGHEGITILATNLRQHLDEAFIRRIHVIVEFPLPAREERIRIWRQNLPAQITAGVIDFPFLAQSFELSGGNISNIALSAAFLAADEGSAISMQHVVQATQRELEKAGKRTIAEEFGRYAPFLSSTRMARLVQTNGEGSYGSQTTKS
jgi:ATPase family associated with various cellular activities (AAA)